MEANVSVRSELINPFKKSKKKWIYGGIAIVVVLGVGIPTTMKAMNGSIIIPTNDIYQVHLGTVMQSIDTSGTIQAPTEIDGNFEGGSGAIQSVNVKVGQHVKAGQVLATLSNTSAKAQVTQAESGVAQAQANLASAQAKLTETKQGLTSVQAALDENSVQKAQLALTQAKQAYQAQLAQSNDKSSLEQQVLSAQNQLAKDQLTTGNTGPLTLAKQQLTDAQTSLANAQQQLAIVQAENGSVTSTQVQQAYAVYQADLTQYEGAVHSGSATQSDINALQSQMQTDQTYYNNLDSQYQSVQQAQQAVTQAQEQVAQDQNSVTNAQNSITLAQQQVRQDELSLAAAQDAYNNPTSAQQALQNAQNQVQQAQLNLQSAQETYEQQKQPADPATLAQAEAAVTTAQAGVTSAEAQLQNAQLAEANTVLKAPIDGVVTQVNYTAGEQVSGTSPVVVIDDIQKKDLQVSLQVSESQYGSIKTGQSVTYTVPAYPNSTFTGTVTQIDPTPTSSSNVTQFTVLATIDNSSGQLTPGMTASAVIQTAQKSNVVTIPAVALQQMGNLEGVYLYGTQPTSLGGGGWIRGAGSSGGSTSGSSTSGGWGGSSSGSGWTRGSGSYSGGGSGGTGGFSGSGSSGTGRSFGQGGSMSGFSGMSSSASSKSSLPKGVYFQPVRVGLMGSNTVEITAGLKAGEQILLALPGQSTTSSSSSTSRSTSGFGLGLGGFGGGGGGGYRSGGGGSASTGGRG